MSEQRPLVLVVTGLSGAGKSTVLNALEDLDFFCVDNLPTPGVLTSLSALAGEGLSRVALGLDVRVRSFLEEAPRILDIVQEQYDVQVLFLDASDQALLRRFSSTRRPHPLSTRAPHDRERRSVAVLDGIQIEREILSALRARASVLIDTTELSVHDLRRRVVELFGAGGTGAHGMRVRVVSFGFKYGLPVDADLMFDVRFLKNPFFDPQLKPLTGLDPAVRDYVLETEDAEGWKQRAQDLLAFCIPRYEREGKSYLTIAIGCTGGRHRSVALTEAIGKGLSEQLKITTDIVHRDVGRVVDYAQDPALREGKPG